MPNIELVFTDDYLSHIEGKLLTTIEAMGFQPRQEESFKSLVRGCVWDDAHNGWATPVEKEVLRDFLDKQV